MSFSQIQVITSMNRVQNLKVALSQLGVSGMTVIQAIGCGAQKGTLEYEPEQNKIMELLPYLQINNSCQHSPSSWCIYVYHAQLDNYLMKHLS